MTEDPDLAIELAREAVARLAPEELPLFAPTSQLYAANPAAVESQAEGDDVLGFGAEALTALTPIALSVAGAVASFVVAQVRGAVEAESETAVRAMVRRLFRLGDDGGEAPPSLSAEQLRRIREVALERARRLKLPDDQAQLLADAMVGGLAVA